METVQMNPDETSPAGRGEAATHGSLLPSVIGRYRILSLLGEGGMGAVYEAEQDRPRRTVALKVIKGAWASQELIRRFEQESQLLARLQHPGIAQVYEAGTVDTASGLQPYFAMELIARAQPLTEFAEARHLNVRQKLELMAEVCDSATTPINAALSIAI
jgi:serine/threonine protein kinase